jgi:hypothetical protein
MMPFQAALRRHAITPAAIILCHDFHYAMIFATIACDCRDYFAIADIIARCHFHISKASTPATLPPPRRRRC